MGVLTAKIFTDADPRTVKSLEDCATGRPSEAVSHFIVGSEGEAVTRLQKALKAAKDKDVTLKAIPVFSVNGKYDPLFYNAIAKYKEIRKLYNYNKNIDGIVGIKTIRKLNEDNKPSAPKVDPAPTPPAPTPDGVATERRQIFKETFEKKYYVQEMNENDEAAPLNKLGEILWQTVKDIQRAKKEPIEAGDFDDGDVRKRDDADIPISHVLKKVVIIKRGIQQPNFVTWGLYAVRYDITRTYRYIYDAGSPSDQVTVTKSASSKSLDGTEIKNDGIKTCDQPLNYQNPK